MYTAPRMKEKLETVFDKPQAEVLTEVIQAAYNDLVKTSDFNELKEIVRDLAEAQKKTETKVTELAEAQKKTEISVGELAGAQKKTEGEIRLLTRETKKVQVNLGGLGRSMGYALENEAYIHLPDYLKGEYGIEITEKMLRTEIEGEEINIFGKGRRNGAEVMIVGEATSRLSKRDKFRQLERKASLVQDKYNLETIKLIITHYATPAILESAKQRGIVIIQSFEW